MLFLYNLPSTVMAAIVVGMTLACALLGYALFRRCAPLKLDAEQRSMTISMVSVVTTINSLLVAFAAISVWDAYNYADRIVTDEATCASELARDLASFHTPAADMTGRALRSYLDQVVQIEWPMMQQRAQFDAHTEQQFDAMFDEANRIEPATPRQDALLNEVLSRVNDMAKYRQQRIMALGGAMPAPLWGAVLMVSGLSFALLYVLPATRFNVAMLSVWAMTLGFSFFFLLAVDHPFVGDISVSAAPFQQITAELIANGTWPAMPVH